MKEAYPDGVTLRMSTSTLVPNQIEIDQVIAATLQQIGVTVNVERLEVGAFRTSYNTYDINLNTLASFNNDPDFLLGIYTGGAGQAVFHFKDEKVRRPLRRTTRRDARQAGGRRDCRSPISLGEPGDALSDR